MMLATALTAAHAFGPPGANHGCPLEGALVIVDETHGALAPTVQISGDRSELTMRLVIGGLQCTSVYSAPNAGGIAGANRFTSVYERTSHGPAACHQFYNECDEVCMSRYRVAVAPRQAAFGIAIESAASVPPGCTCYEGEGAMDLSCPADADTTTTTTTTTTAAASEGGVPPAWSNGPEVDATPDGEAVRHAWNNRPEAGPPGGPPAVVDRLAVNTNQFGRTFQDRTQPPAVQPPHRNPNRINDWDTDDIVWARQRQANGGETRPGSPGGPPTVADRLAVNTNQFGRTFQDRTQPPAVQPPHRTGDGSVGIKVGDLDFPGFAEVAVGEPGAGGASAPKPSAYDEYDDSWNGGAIEARDSRPRADATPDAGGNPGAAAERERPSTVVLRGRVIDISDTEHKIAAAVDGALARAIPRAGAALRDLIIAGILGEAAAVANEGIGN